VSLLILRIAYCLDLLQIGGRVLHEDPSYGMCGLHWLENV